MANDWITVDIANLTVSDRNPRIHSQQQIDEMKKSLKQFGQTRAIVIDELNNVLVGHGLLTAMQQMGMKTALCNRIVDLTEKDKKALMLADNRIYELGENDEDVIREYITELSDTDIPGFGIDDINSILNKMTDDIENNDEEEDVDGYDIVCPYCGTSIHVIDDTDE